MVGCGILVWTLGRTGGIPPLIPGRMWSPGLDPGRDRRDLALDPRWEAGSYLGSRLGGIPVSTPGRTGGILPWIPGSRQSHLGSQVGLVGSRLNPAWLFNWGFCRHHSILKSYLTTFTSSPVRQIYFHLTMIRQRERTLRQICRRSQNISHRIFTD